MIYLLYGVKTLIDSYIDKKERENRRYKYLKIFSR